MFKFLWNRAEAAACRASDWRHDPLGHPALQEMNLRELADLPLVAEIPVRMTRVAAAEDFGRGVDRENSGACRIPLICKT